MEGIQDRFVRWTMELDWRTPLYMIKEREKYLEEKQKIELGIVKTGWRKKRKGSEEMLGKHEEDMEERQNSEMGAGKRNLRWREE